MNNIQNYGMANYQLNNNANINFRAFVPTEAAKTKLVELYKILDKYPQTKLETIERNKAMEIMNLINQIRLFAEKSRFYDLVVDYMPGWGRNMDFVFGIKKCFEDKSTTLRQVDDFSYYKNFIFLGKRMEHNPETCFSLALKNKDTAKELTQKLNGHRNKPDYDNTNLFLDFYKHIELASQLDEKNAKNTIKNLIEQ